MQRCRTSYESGFRTDERVNSSKLKDAQCFWASLNREVAHLVGNLAVYSLQDALQLRARYELVEPQRKRHEQGEILESEV